MIKYEDLREYFLNTYHFISLEMFCTGKIPPMYISFELTNAQVQKYNSIQPNTLKRYILLSEQIANEETPYNAGILNSTKISILNGNTIRIDAFQGVFEHLIKCIFSE